MDFRSALRCAFLLFLALPASTSFEWTSSGEVPDGSVYRACVGEEVRFRWNFSLSADERAVHVEWYRSNDKNQVLLAVKLANHFLPAHNVTFLPTAGLRVFLTDLNAFGTYTVKVEYQDKRGYLLSSQQSAIVALEDAPVLEGGQLVAQMLSDTVQDEATGLLQVQLACGRFITRGSRPVSVVWKTPSGETIPSTTYTDGTFRLHLAHPQPGGYSCHLEKPDMAARCIPNISRLLRGAFVHVDEVEIRLVLLEGEARSLRANSRNVDLELERQAKRFESRDQNLTAEVNRLAEIAEALEVQTESLAANNEKLKAQVEKQAEDIDDLKAHTEDLTKENELLKASTAEFKKEQIRMAGQLQNLSEEASDMSETHLTTTVPDCQTVKAVDSKSGVSNLVLHNVTAFCDQETDGGGWTVIQRRLDGSVDFDRDWDDYVTGFGDPSGEYWLGLDAVHRLVSMRKHSLRIDLTDWEGKTAHALYDSFSISGPETNYTLAVDGYSGDAGDALIKTGDYGPHNGMQFTTLDRDNDPDSSQNCAERYDGGWWFKKCFNANLNGKYETAGSAEDWHGILWYPWREKESLKAAEMKIRPSA